MLQQTTVKAVVPYYESFVERFLDVDALAGAREDDVVAAWSGLGYYHRARNLHRGATHVRDKHAGRFPRTLEAALAVPGVGLYTASAILSIAYDVALPVVDGNVRRVLARLRAARAEVAQGRPVLQPRAGGAGAGHARRLEPGRHGAGRSRLHAAAAGLRGLPAALVPRARAGHRGPAARGPRVARRCP